MNTATATPTTTTTAAAQANPQTGELPAVGLAAEALERFQELLLQPHDLKPAPPDPFDPKSVDEMWALAEIYAKSDFVPKDYQGKPANCFVAMNWGKEIGLKPLQSLQNIAVINGRPSLWGDAQLAIVRSSPHCEYVHETMDDNGTALCRAKRRGEPMEHVVTFSIEDQKTAGLMGKSGPHTQYPKRMRQLRARSFALRDKFTDVLRGIPQTEELLTIAPPTGGSVAELPRNASATQIAAAAAPKAGAEIDNMALQERLMKVAAEEGTKAFKKAWNALAEEERVAVGIPERDRLLAVGKRTDEQVAAGQQQLPAGGANGG